MLEFNKEPFALSRYVLIVLGISTSILLGFSLTEISTPPLSYLHSWNQITTLSVTRAIARQSESWKRPQEVVTRIPWLQGRTLQEDAVTPFVIFEESPLYPLMITAISTDPSAIVALARGISLVALILSVIAMYQLLERRFEPLDALLACSLMLTSFPFLYYGQGTMSDMLMVGLLLAGTLLLENERYPGRRFWGIVALSLAALAKSYAIFFAVPLYCLRPMKPSSPRLIRTTGALLLLLVPVLSWHLFTLTQAGHQEADSHSVIAKLAAFTEPSLYNAFFKIFFRYLGIVPGALFLLVLLWKRRFETTWWIHAWLAGGVIYGAFCVDKLTVHDYYFLPIFIPIFAIAGTVFASKLREMNQTTALIPLTIAFAVSCLLTAKNLSKALTPNTDVIECSALAGELSKPGDFLATLSDVSRFNSLAYLSGRKAVNVEGTSLPLSQYLHAGVSFLVMNLPTEESISYRDWILSQGGIEKATRELRDARGRLRTCAVYELPSPSKSS